VAFFRGNYYALDDTCPHAGCSLAQGELDKSELTCICHGSRFDIVSGSVLAGPATDDADVIPVFAEEGALWVDL
jgi:nitrite reductase/ring-hydroxylating ferredoxin subunit